jgi:hypothetical protein
MSKPKKPQGPRVVITNDIADICTQSLAPHELQLLRAFRELDDESQEFMIETAEISAQNPSLRRHPLHPALRLVSGGKA